MIDININDIFFKSYSVDPITKQSIYVFDSTYLPSPEEVGDKQVYDLLINELMDRLITKLPASPYSLVVFTSGFSQKKISWVYAIKMFNKLPIEARHYLQQTFIVHESFFIRTVYQVLSNAMSMKFLRTTNQSNNTESIEYSSDNSTSNNDPVITHVADLTQLSHLIDITRLRISLNVYLYDYQITEYIDVPKSYFERLTVNSNKHYKQLVFDKIFQRLKKEGMNTELIFQKPGSYKKVNILLDIINRNNYIDLSQWDIYSLATIFLHFLKNKSKPLVPIDLIKLPIYDTFSYTYKIFIDIIKFNNYQDFYFSIFPLFQKIINNKATSKLDPRLLAKALAPTLCKEKISLANSDVLAIGARFIRNLLNHYDEVKLAYDTNKIPDDTPPRRSISEVVQSPTRKSSYTNLNVVNSSSNNITTNGKLTLRTVSQPPLLPKPRKNISPIRIDLRSRSPSPNRASSNGSKSHEIHSIRNSSNGSVGESSIQATLTSTPIQSQNQNSNQNQDQSKKDIPGSTSNEKRNNSPTRPPPRKISNEHAMPAVPVLKPKSSASSLMPSSKSISSGSTLGSNSTTNSSVSGSSTTAISKPKTANIYDTYVNDDSMILGDDRDVEELVINSQKLSLIVDKNQEKIILFDKELQKKKKKEGSNKSEIQNKFSTDGYSGIKTGNRVSKLAALYEERLMGIQALNEMKRS
ncbi:hypothetical protein TBLA_0J00560 [Henningerozyma blattae CBS 6284]|uniref:Rho-GAP domain-containing protein n=1 Tax=Henningerozyma blattae (strain ATCC 34711 / CBS 6284 / DSM 70876 / NBRC 10599 / NRRL Y-10934 / UCD 77-7) TaxID=1071380 RepID=I2H9K4_HENB6|nr:hypothetical protein TBLA_0J00560 [Tetrapisispora blattae CBS 6284]CCH63056.1 hypothetical protein TBLA_0J00560 [Tetrapisispora blattae CBS 6284]